MFPVASFPRAALGVTVVLASLLAAEHAHAVDSSKPGSVVLDTQMPGADGFVNGVTLEPNTGGLFLFGSERHRARDVSQHHPHAPAEPADECLRVPCLSFAQVAGAGQNTQAGLAFDGLGNLFAAGCGGWRGRDTDTGSRTRAPSWVHFAKHDDYQLAPGKAARLMSIKADAQGNMFAAGWALDANGRSPHAIVRRSRRGGRPRGSPWSTTSTPRTRTAAPSISRSTRRRGG